MQFYPVSQDNTGFFVSMGVVLISFTALVFTLLASKWTTKPILIISLLVSSLVSYFMNTYNIVIDDDMIRNLLQTDIHESMDLLNIKIIVYFVLLGLVPSYIVYKTPIHYRTMKKELLCKTKYMGVLLSISIVMIFMFSKHYISFVREHKPLRYSANPTYWIYSTGNYVFKTFTSRPVVIKPIGSDAKVQKEPNALPKLVILVVGEAARADHFSLNGYEKETNPLLKKETIMNFSNVYSCGTSTAVSVPCMFSVYDKSEYSYKKAYSTENVLDVLNHTQAISILWRDNNSDSKGVALRVPYEDYKSSYNNTICTIGECRDEGMLVGLDDYIQKQQQNDILIVLHQMGNHGPAYYKRYPKSFEKFTPVCETNQLEKCSKKLINNAYDNAILYTDAFLSKTINLLKKYTDTHQTAMIYMSDHGESLGENALYLHGLPYFMAPDAQIHIPALMWIGESFKKLQNLEHIDTKKHYSQDNLFHTLLGIFDVKTEVYDNTKDVLKVK